MKPVGRWLVVSSYPHRLVVRRSLSSLPSFVVIILILIVVIIIIVVVVVAAAVVDLVQSSFIGDVNRVVTESRLRRRERGVLEGGSKTRDGSRKIAKEEEGERE